MSKRRRRWRFAKPPPLTHSTWAIYQCRHISLLFTTVWTVCSRERARARSHIHTMCTENGDILSSDHFIRNESIIENIDASVLYAAHIYVFCIVWTSTWCWSGFLCAVLLVPLLLSCLFARYYFLYIARVIAVFGRSSSMLFWIGFAALVVSLYSVSVHSIAQVYIFINIAEIYVRIGLLLPSIDLCRNSQVFAIENTSITSNQCII